MFTTTAKSAASHGRELAFRPSVTRPAGVATRPESHHADGALALHKEPLANVFHSSHGLVHIIIIITGDSKAYQSFKKGAAFHWEIFHFIAELKQ